MLDLIVQALPPEPDAIGEYTALLAKELCARDQVRVLTSARQPWDAVEGVEIHSCFKLQGKQRFRGLLQTLLVSRSDAVVLQYNPFSWGSRGWAPDLVRVCYDFKMARPEVNLGVMFHETYMMNPGWKSWVMRIYQRKQFSRLNQLADVAFYSTKCWADQQLSRTPNARIFHLPVGANLPPSNLRIEEARHRLGLAGSDFVCGMFGGAHPSKMLPWIVNAINQIVQKIPSSRRVVFLHIGGEHMDWNDVAAPVVRTGRLSARAATDAVAALDLMISPFIDGLSTRRGSVMAALQNGVPVLSTSGPATDPIWETQINESVFLAKSNDERQWRAVTDTCMRSILAINNDMRNKIRKFYQSEFSWPVIAKNLRHHLSMVR